MNRIFRIESVEKRGMYCGHMWDGIRGVIKLSERHPDPHKDSKLLNENRDLFCFSINGPYFKAYKFVFGFSSIDQLRRWIYQDSWLKSLEESGYMLNIYEGDVRPGYTQAVINSHTAALIESHKISDYFNL